MRTHVMLLLCTGSLAAAAIAQGRAQQNPEPGETLNAEQAELAELRAENERLRASRRDLDKLRRFVRGRLIPPPDPRFRTVAWLPGDLSLAEPDRAESRAYREALRALDTARTELARAGDDEVRRGVLDDLETAAAEVRAALWKRVDETDVKKPSELRAENEELRAEMQSADSLVRIARDDVALFLPARPGPAVQLDPGLLLGVSGIGERARMKVVVQADNPATAEPAPSRGRAYDDAARKLRSARSSLTEAGDDHRAALEALDALTMAVMEARAALREQPRTHEP